MYMSDLKYPLKISLYGGLEFIAFFFAFRICTFGTKVFQDERSVWIKKSN